MIKRIAKKELTKIRSQVRFHLWAMKWLGLAASIVTSANAQTPSSFVLENIEAKPGETTSGFVAVPAGVDEGTRIPISVIHGAKSGKILLIISGIHGSEYAPILALQKLRSLINPKELSGTVILVHVANMPSFLKRTIYYGSDGKNLNRVFPGKADGTIAERIAHTLLEKIVKKADIAIDVHSGDNNESLRPYVVYYDYPSANRDIVETSRRMAHAFGIDFVKTTQLTELNYDTSMFGTRAIFALGKPVMAVESGELGKPEVEAVTRIERGLLNVLRELEMLPGKPAEFKKRILIKRDQTLRSATTGLFYSLVTRDQRVKENDLLGYVTDFFGNRVQEVRAPFAGVVMYFTATPPVSEGEPLVNVGEIEAVKK